MFIRRNIFRLPATASFGLLAIVGLSTAVNAATVTEITNAGQQRAEAAAADQKRIDQVADQIEDLVIQFQTEAKVVDGLKVYNSLLQRQIDNQEAEKAALAQSIDNVALIERQIVPMMTRMLDSLEEFVELDTPFLLEERTDRIARLRDMMDRSDVTAAEKLRQILEAYSIENDYGRTIEAYKDSVDVEGRTMEADFLRIGRVSLAYQTVGGGYTGAWDNEARTWVELPPATFKTQVTDGLKIARKQVAPDMLVVPVAAPEGVNP